VVQPGSGPGPAVVAISNLGSGIVARSETSQGVFAFSRENIGVEGEGKQVGVLGLSETIGVKGECNLSSPTATSIGVMGNCPNPGSGIGVLGTTADGIGVQGKSASSGALGFLGGRDPVFNQHTGVYGQSDQQGVMGLSTIDSGTGVFGGNTSGRGFGVRGDTSNGVGVQGESFAEGVAIQGRSHGRSQGLAARFIGNVHVQGNPGTSSGDLRVEGVSSFGGSVTMDGNVTCAGKITAFDVSLSGGDCAEDFDIAGQAAVDPGTVMVIDSEGALRPCEAAYDKKVTGVISGAGNYKPGIVLDKRGSSDDRLPLALIGKVFCKVDANFGPVEIGDLLTTSTTIGHAMKANDMLKAFGAVIGKALQPIAVGQGLIAILVALQ
jgi:hypothetical protein